MKKWFESNTECPAGCGCRCGDILSSLDEDKEETNSRLRSGRKNGGNGQGPTTEKSDSSRTNDSDGNDTESDLYDDDDDDDDDDMLTYDA